MKTICTTLFVCVLLNLAIAQSLNTHLVKNVDDYSNIGYTDCWGYTAPDGSEYAFLGTNAGVSIVATSDTSNIAEVDFMPFVNGGWYDMKTYQHYMYVSSESSNQVMIVDLSALPDSARLVGFYGNLPTRPHNIFVDTDMGILYIVEDFNFNRSVSLHSLIDPENPVEISFLGAGLGTDAHDVFAQDSVLYVAEGVNGTLGIFDVSDPANPTLLQRVSIPSPGYVHNVWVSQDNRYMISTEETAFKTVKVWDISDLNGVTLLDEYAGGNHLAHNAFFNGDFAFISHYQSGLKILDVADPENIIEIGNFDTIDGEAPVTFGNWGVYPFTQNGLIYLSDMVTGLYVVEFNHAQAFRVNGIVKDVLTDSVIQDARIEVLETGLLDHSDAGGQFKTGFPGSGTMTLKIEAFGYFETTVSLSAVAGNVENIEVNLNPLPRAVIFGTVKNENDDPLAGLTLHLEIESPLLSDTLLLTAHSGVDGQYTFENLPVAGDPSIRYNFISVEQSFPFARSEKRDLALSPDIPNTIDFQLNPADVLLVNDDPGENFMSKYRDATKTLPITVFEWFTVSDGSAIPVSRMDEFRTPTIVWFTGDAQTNVLNATERDSLAAFLDAGGNLLLTGQNIAEDLATTDPNYLQTYLQVEYDGLGSGPPLIRTVDENPVFGSVSDFPASQSSRDVLIIPAAHLAPQPAFKLVNGKIVGVTTDDVTNGSKVVFLGFGLEAITIDVFRSDVISAALNWFNVITGVNDDAGGELPQQFALEQNYPNPFNPSTTIRYELQAAGRVELAVFNLLGQRIRTLVSGRQAAGEYAVEWNGIDERGNPVGSGVYFYQMKAEKFSEIRKMVLIR